MEPLWLSHRVTQALLWCVEHVRGRGGIAEQWHALAARSTAGGQGALGARALLKAARLVALWAALCLAATLTMLTGFCFVGTVLAAQTLLRWAARAGRHAVAFRL